MVINELLKKCEIVSGDFNNLGVFKFEGVYILYNENDNEVVYVGSAYSRNIEERLKQYIQKK